MDEKMDLMKDLLTALKKACTAVGKMVALWVYVMVVTLAVGTVHK
jgi:hypothetical protein